ncbi:hypothetical protein FSP39_004947 [Pinctada imbricata]|uniref:Mannose-P-dolichol utilization defect 1 protein homolog n=1 Tax=Pinctada imbricata TaxID=66713 RepID=A0AA88XZB7_PINIB|nr:hypothetical protein FSP39_004947 [Pinctada imbricata]
MSHMSMNLLHVLALGLTTVADCMKLVLSKCLGFVIILGSVMVKIPQLVKIINNQSAQGISLMAVLCELFAVSATTVYSFAKSFPFSSYGEGLFLVIQTSLIAFCVLFYNGNLQGGLGFLAVYIGLMVFLMSSMAPMPLLSLLQSSNIPIAIISKLIQAVTNVRNGGTGQLSVVTVFLLFAGSIARIFTSIQETGDSLVVATYVVSTACNGLIFAQILYYWNAKPKPKSE